MAFSLAELRRLSDEDLAKRHDEIAAHSPEGTWTIRDELSRREARRLEERMVRLTEQMRLWTVMVAVLTLVNVIIFVIGTARGR
jgi:sugar phosphate isomerase/epimerase